MTRQNRMMKGSIFVIVVFVMMMIIYNIDSAEAVTAQQKSTWDSPHKNRFERMKELLATSENTIRWLTDPLVPSPPLRCQTTRPEDQRKANMKSDTQQSALDEVPLLRPAPQRQHKCTDYERQANCWSASPLADTRPAQECPSLLKNQLGASKVKQSIVAISGDFGLSGTGCSELVSDLLTKLERQFGNYTYILSLGDGAYWDGSCKAHRNIYGQAGSSRWGSAKISGNQPLIYRRYFPPANTSCIDPVKVPQGWWKTKSETKSYEGYTHNRANNQSPIPSHHEQVDHDGQTEAINSDTEYAAKLSLFYERNPGFKHLFPPLGPSKWTNLASPGHHDTLDHVANKVSSSSEAQPFSLLRFKPDPSVPEAVKLAQQIAHMKSALAQASPPASCSNTTHDSRSSDSVEDTAERRAERVVLARLLAQFSVAGDYNSLDPTKYKFFPVLGNHDFDEVYKTVGRMPFNQYFPYLSQLPPGEDLSHGMWYTYISPILPHVQLFALNSNLGHFGTDTDKLLYRAQVTWLKQALLSSTALFKIVYFHHPPHTTAVHDGNAQWMNLPYKSWGADVVLTGHQHAYERIVLPFSLAKLEDKFAKEHWYPEMSRNASALYFLNGLGGHSWIYSITGCDEHPGSQLRYNKMHGAMVAVITESVTGESIDIDPSTASKNSRKQSSPMQGNEDTTDPQWMLASSFFKKKGGDHVTQLVNTPTNKPTNEIYKASKEISFCFYSVSDEGKLVDSTSVFAP